MHIKFLLSYATDLLDRETRTECEVVMYLYRMAPEVIACETSTEEPYTCSADIWSFGPLYLTLGFLLNHLTFFLLEHCKALLRY